MSDEMKLNEEEQRLLGLAREIMGVVERSGLAFDEVISGLSGVISTLAELDGREPSEYFASALIVSCEENIAAAHAAIDVSAKQASIGGAVQAALAMPNGERVWS